jgi:hypothetical protein
MVVEYLYMNQYEIVVVEMIEYEIQFQEIEDYPLLLNLLSSLDILFEPLMVVDQKDI